MFSSAFSMLLPLDKEGFKETLDFLYLFSFSLQVGLHACGIATDMVMEHCIQAEAAFVISPCCYGFIQNAVKFTFPKRFVPVHRVSVQYHFSRCLLLQCCF